MNVEVVETSTALTLVQRAQIALQSEENERKLKELAASTKDITAITNSDGYKQCHSMRMALRNMRVYIEKVAKAARQDATDFQKACVTEQNRLVAIIDPEEVRLEAMQKAWDDAKEREKQAKAEVERKRLAAIQERIEMIRDQVADAVGESAAAIEERIKSVVGLPIDDSFAEMKSQAEAIKAATLVKLRTAHSKQVAQEEEATRLAAERKRLEAERQEHERLQAVERARLAEEERKAREARENEEKRIASIRARIQAIREYPDGASLKSAADVQEMLDTAKGYIIDDAYAELRAEAGAVLDDVIRTLTNIHYERKTHEDERNRLAAERQRLAEQERVAATARKAEEDRLAVERQRQKDEADRLEIQRQEAAHQEAARLAVIEAEEKRIADERAALEAERAQQAEQHRMREAGDGAPVGATASEIGDSNMEHEGGDAVPAGIPPVVPQATSLQGFIDIVFDGPPDATAGRFVEVEDARGKSISVGEWIERADGHWALRVNAAELGIVPSAWMRRVESPGTPFGPPEVDYECYAGDEPPDQQPGWVPLYRKVDEGAST